jgi:pyridoxal 5'-phosphate synthase pdxT subunit
VAGKRIGILAIHGSVVEHAESLRKLKFEPVEIRAAKDLETVEGLILPGGESTTIGDLAQQFGLREAIVKFAKSEKTIYGTCAGLILLARYGLLDVKIDRNAYGRQIHSFEVDLEISALKGKSFNGVFIRAPKIISVGKSVEILAQFEKSPILVKQGNIWGGSFHPELTPDLRIHKLIFGNK